MPSPVLIVGGVVIAVGAGFAFKQFVYDPYLSDRVQLWVEDFSHIREQRHRRLVDAHPSSPSSRGKRSPAGSFSEKRRSIDDGVNGAGSSTGTEMREVPSVSNVLRRRAASFQRSSTELEMAVIGDSFPLSNAVEHARQSPHMSDSARQLQPLFANLRSPVLPPAIIPTPPPTSPRSPFSDLHALSEISFDASSSADPFEYQFSPPTELHAALSPPATTVAAPFSPFVLPRSPPATSADPFVDVPAPAQRPASPWSELSVNSTATAGQLHLHLSRTDSDSEQDRRSDSGSDGSWEHT